MIHNVLVQLLHIPSHNVVCVRLSRDNSTTWESVLVTQVNGTWKRYLKSFLWRHMLASKVQIDEFIAQVENSV